MFSILSRRLYPEKIGFWVWVLDWVLYQNPNQKPNKFYTQTLNLNPKPKNFYSQFQNLNPKPKKIYTQTQNPKIFIPKPKT